nr:MAG TPA: hypothetical protein [Caudoviricetes sp.]
MSSIDIKILNSLYIVRITKSTYEIHCHKWSR